MAVIVRGARLRSAQLAALIVLVITAGLIVAARPAPAALPASTVIGTVTFVGLNGGPNATTSAIPIKSYSWSVTNTPTQSGPAKAVFSKFSFVKALDGASPPLFKAAAVAQHYTTVTVNLYDPATTTIRAVYTLNDVLVTSVADAQAANNTSSQTETIGLLYTKVRETWTRNPGPGTTTYCYNLQTQTAC